MLHMTDEQHARAIRTALAQLNATIRAAAEDGLTVQCDARTVREHVVLGEVVLEQAVTATVARKVRL